MENELIHANTVELIGYYGGDETHALSAWTSTFRELTEDRKSRLAGMLTTLAENGHHTPFEKSYIHFLVTCDTASHIHLLKHRIGVNINAESARYKELEDKIYLPEDWDPGEKAMLVSFCDEATEYYHESIHRLVELGLTKKRAKESARFYLPYASQVTMDIGFNFRSFMHFQKLRNSPDAQLEIRSIAEKMLKLVFKTNDFNLSLKGFGYDINT